MKIKHCECEQGIETNKSDKGDIVSRCAEAPADDEAHALGPNKHGVGGHTRVEGDCRFLECESARRPGSLNFGRVNVVLEVQHGIRPP